ncbi:pentatricopeptide repeat-containing protein At5g02860-like [Argentina anserina]|uniref:pentatricopeptide repeat-containing protein At5g02860-like n=1 Tax=Argentina anserina TaxID=57926 RepID=UPI002176571B|nr:pentatricopeptide repeat-containing protein At5g02860-like [Potentilla anserina]
MASSGSRSRSRFKTKKQITVKINSPHIGNLVFEDSKLPSAIWEGGELPRIVVGPGDPEDLPQIFNKVVNSREGFIKHSMKMIDNLLTDGYNDLAMEIGNDITEEGSISKVVVLTGIVDEYAEAGKTMEALYVYRMMLESERCAPNAYTYSVVIKALAADPDPSFLGVAKEYVMEMMGKGLQPNAKTYTAVLEAFAGHEKMEEGKMFLEGMKANGFVANREAMRAMRHVLKGKGPLVRFISEILFDNSEDNSGDSEHDDDDMNKSNRMMEQMNCPPNGYVGKKHVIEDDPENPKDLECVFDMMCKMEPLVHTLTRMVNMLKKDGFMSQAHEIRDEFESGDIPEVVTHTGVIEIYAKNDQAKEARKVFLRMLSLGVTPNAYTYSVIIKALAKDSDFFEDAKTYLLEMMDKGMQPNARTYTPVFKAFARLEEDNVKKGKEFLMEMKAKGFRAKRKAVMEVLKGRKGPVVQTVITVLFNK